MQPNPGVASENLGWTISVTPASTLTTAQISIDIVGLHAGAACQLVLHPSDYVVAQGFADELGHATFAFRVPSTLGAGSYSIALTSVSSSDSAFTSSIATFDVAGTGIVTDTTTRDGALGLEVPISAAATFSAPVLENNISTTRGTLGTVTVADNRTQSKRGWTLFATVTSFVFDSDSSVSMPSNLLGIEPLRFAPSSTATGVKLGTKSVPGDTTYPYVFAEADAGSGVGVTALDANLMLISPPSFPVGRYTATLTLTLVSK